ncbi:hypothetical protein C9I50_18180 [Pseudomonas prosekii]|uniref:hypothetical protein n=1 Tax=Pseudomonas prosekii TaxID=1148509 RepID=UPI000D614B2B|nr:hypothetical protein [Pseudomonas prosekii]PWE39599.1 hypothetical protein C9I50_18180 [Pseudomonas prosekii]
MARYRIAHIKEQGQQMIIAPLDSSFNSRSQDEKNDFMNAFQAAATSAGLAGRVALIWKSGSMVHFMAPQPWHPFFRSQGIYQTIMSSINKELTIH